MEIPGTINSEQALRGPVALSDTWTLGGAFYVEAINQMPSQARLHMHGMLVVA